MHTTVNNSLRLVFLDVQIFSLVLELDKNVVGY